MIRKFRITVQGQTYDVEVEELTPSQSSSVSKQPSSPIKTVPTTSKPPVPPPVAGVGSGTIKAPLPGEILKVLVKEGDVVNAGDALLILEAMKMESEIPADRAGTIKKILVEKGAIVESGEDLVIIE